MQRGATLGKLIVSAREAKGWSQKQLRQVVHIGQSRMSKIENDNAVPDFHELDRIALVLGKTLSHFSLLQPPPAEMPAAAGALRTV